MLRRHGRKRRPASTYSSWQARRQAWGRARRERTTCPDVAVSSAQPSAGLAYGWHALRYLRCGSTAGRRCTGRASLWTQPFEMQSRRQGIGAQPTHGHIVHDNDLCINDAPRGHKRPAKFCRATTPAQCGDAPTAVQQRCRGRRLGHRLRCTRRFDGNACRQDVRHRSTRCNCHDGPFLIF